MVAHRFWCSSHGGEGSCGQGFLQRALFARKYFGPSENVPGGYVVYLDGRLRDMTNVAVTSLDPEDIVCVEAT